MQRACARPQSARTGTVLQRSPSLCPGRLVATSSWRTKHAHVKPCQAVADQPFADDESSNTDYAAVAASLNSLLAKTAPSNAISGRDLRDLVRQKWGRSFAADPALYFHADDESSNTDYAAVAASLNSLLAKTAPSNAISGRDLRDLVRQKWGRSYDVRLAKLQGRMYLQVMWKFLEQASFPLTEQEYMQQLDAVAEYLNDWGAAETVRQGIQAARRPPGYTGGGNARCISIPLAVDLGGTRSAEWI